MRSIFVRRICAGLVGSLLAAPVGLAQQQGGTGQTGGGGTQTGGTGSTQQSTTGTTGTTGGTSNYSGTSSFGSQTAGSNTGGVNMPQVTFGGGGATNNPAGGSAGRSSSGRSRATGATGQRGITAGGLGAGNIGRGMTGQSSQQMRRQSDRFAQFSTQLDTRSFGPAITEPGSTLALRSKVEQSISSALPGGVQVTIDGSGVVLSGKVSNDGDRKLAERMALLEPGVRSVRNELVVEAK